MSAVIFAGLLSHTFVHSQLNRAVSVCVVPSCCRCVFACVSSLMCWNNGPLKPRASIYSWFMRPEGPMTLTASYHAVFEWHFSGLKLETRFFFSFFFFVCNVCPPSRSQNNPGKRMWQTLHASSYFRCWWAPQASDQPLKLRLLSCRHRRAG